MTLMRTTNLFLPLASLVLAGCNVTEKVPCADDSSCPRDYQVCQGATPAQNGFCVAGTAANASSVDIVAVDRSDQQAAAAPLAGSAVVTVSARTPSGVKSVTVTANGKALPALPGGAPSLFKFTLDATDIAIFPTSDATSYNLVASLVPGDGSAPITSAPRVVTIDNKKPVLTVAAPALPDTRPGAIVGLDVTASESPVTLSADVLFGGDVIGHAEETLPPTGLVHHLGFAVVNGLAAGAYTFSVSARDAAGNVSAPPVTKPFTVAPAPTSQLTTDKAIVTKGDSVTLHAFLTNGTAVLGLTGSTTQLPVTTDGQLITVNPIVTTTYTLTVTNIAGAAVSSSATVVVVELPTASLTGVGTINPGQTATLTATAANAISATIEPGAIPVLADGTPQTINVSPSVTTSFKLITVNAAGAVQTGGPVVVTVNRPIIASFTGPAFYTDGKPGGLNLVASFSGGIGALATVSGADFSICTTADPTAAPATFACPSPLTHQNVTYTLTVTLGSGAGSAASANAIVRVAQDPASSTLTLVGAGTVNPGSITTLGGTVCTGCTGKLSPSLGTVTANFLVNTAALQTTTVFTLASTNQAGDGATTTVTVNVNRPTITSFTGPSSYTAGKAGLPLRAVFGGGTGASASLVATAGTTTSTCTPAATTASPQDFSCGPITQDTTYTLTVRLGTGPNSTATSTAVVRVAPVDSTTTGTMGPRFGATVTLLPNGKALIAGGSTATPPTATSIVDTALLFNPVTGNFTSAGAGCGGTKMGSKRYQHTGILLGNGLVLLAGGTPDGTSGNAVNTADLYDPGNDCFAATGALKTKRFGHTATRLASGRVLVAGGTDTTNAALASAELFDGSTFTTITGAFQPTLNAARTQATATLLNNGKVLIAGGGANPDADLYDPTANAGNGSFTTVPLQATRSQHSATVLGNGTILLAGGAGPLASAEIYDPSSNASTVTGSLQTARALHTATLLPAGTVLIAGGTAASGATNSTEVFQPSGTFSSSAPISMPRTEHGATFLFNGTALIVGGSSVTAPGDLLTP